jgi:outer membrane protein insertion porin family
MMPVVNAPFRLYWAYNPQIVQEFLQPPVVLDRSSFANQATFVNALTRPAQLGGAAEYLQANPFFERRSTFRFSIGRTF